MAIYGCRDLPDASRAKDRFGRQECARHAGSGPHAWRGLDPAEGTWTCLRVDGFLPAGRGQKRADGGGSRRRGVASRIDGVTITPIHVPVLAREILQWLDPKLAQVIVDGTLGGGGHTRLISDRLAGDT